MPCSRIWLVNLWFANLVHGYHSSSNSKTLQWLVTATTRANSLLNLSFQDGCQQKCECQQRQRRLIMILQLKNDTWLLMPIIPVGSPFTWQINTSHDFFPPCATFLNSKFLLRVGKSAYKPYGWFKMEEIIIDLTNILKDTVLKDDYSKPQKNLTWCRQAKTNTTYWAPKLVQHSSWQNPD